MGGWDEGLGNWGEVRKVDFEGQDEWAREDDWVTRSRGCNEWELGGCTVWWSGVWPWSAPTAIGWAEYWLFSTSSSSESSVSAKNWSNMLSLSQMLSTSDIVSPTSPPSTPLLSGFSHDGKLTVSWCPQRRLAKSLSFSRPSLSLLFLIERLAMNKKRMNAIEKHIVLTDWWDSLEVLKVTKEMNCVLIRGYPTIRNNYVYSASSLNIPIYHILPTWNVFAHKNKTIDVTIINFGERVDTSI